MESGVPMPSASRVFIIGVAIKKIRDDLQHRLEKADFVIGITSKEAKSLVFQGLLSFLLITEDAMLVLHLADLLPGISGRGHMRQRIMGGLSWDERDGIQVERLGVV